MKNALFAIIILFATILIAKSETLIKGKVVNFDTKQPIENVTIETSDGLIKTSTDSQGDYQINIPKSGEYRIVFTSPTGSQLTKKVKVGNENEILLNIEILSKNYNLGEVVVYGASRRAEKIMYSPSAVSVVFSEELERKSRQGQVAYSVAGNAGIDVLRNGANDFIVNARGFNSGLNRRVLVLQDGRDVAMPLLGALEWNSFSVPMEEFESVEFVRGPSAALYGANAYNGVLLLKSQSPRYNQGGKISILGGDYNTYKFDLRYAGGFDNLFFKVNAGRSHTLNFANRRDSVRFLEYSGLPLEKRALRPEDRNTYSNYGALRLDYYFDDTKSITGEFGYSHNGNEAFVFGLGRTFVKETERPYFRLVYNSERINIHSHYMSRFTPDTMWLLVPNAPLLDNSKDVMFDVQHNFYLRNNLHFIWGVTEQLQYIRTYGTSIPNNVDADFTGVYSQIEWQAQENLKFVGSARYDYASIHPSYFSPRFSVVYSPIAGNQFRVSINKGFQRPNYSELYRLTPDAPAFSTKTNAPVNFKNIEKIIADSIAILSGSRPEINLNLSPTRAFAVGNDKLEVEKITSFEFGYKNTISDNFYVSVDLFYNRLTDFITNFLPGVNPNIQKWVPQLPDSLSQYAELVKNIIYSELSARDRARLSIFNGQPTFIVSNTNIGKVDEYGVEITAFYKITNNLSAKIDYSYFGYDVVENKSAQPLLPNTAPHKANLSLNYIQPNSYDVTLDVYYSHKFDWLAGTFQGKVPSYTILNLNAGYELTNNLSLGINVYNLLNKKHYQIFGGTFIPRIATAKINYKF